MQTHTASMDLRHHMLPIGWWGSATAVPWRATAFTPLYRGQQRCSSNLEWCSHGSAPGRTPGGGGQPHRDGFQSCPSSFSTYGENAGTTPKGGTGNEKRRPVAEAYEGRRALKRTIVLKMSSPKKGAVGEQQHKAQPTEKEGWIPSKLEKKSTGARMMLRCHLWSHSQML
jgi:hypothetical protein